MRSTLAHVMTPGVTVGSALGIGSPLSRFAAWLAIALVIYLPLEPWLLGSLSEIPYWALRLAPDALIIGLAAVVTLTDAGVRRGPRFLLWGLACASLAMVGLNLLRGVDGIAAINALRVVLRYVALGAVLWRYAPDLPRLPAVLAGALLASGAIQMVIGGIELSGLALAGHFDTGLRVPLEGTTGRYDRYGLLMAAVALLLLARSLAQARPGTSLLGLGASLVFLFLSTSRQAELGFGAGAVLLACAPRVPRVGRMIAVGCAVAAALMVLASPSRIPLPPEEDPGGGGVGPPVTAPRGSTALSLDPNANFRLYLNFVLAPWAIGEEPLLGIGPNSHVAPDTDPRLEAEVESAGIPWDWARRFMNDSNYASLVIQFGLPFTILFLGLFVGTLLANMRRAFWRNDAFLRFSVVLGFAVLVVAAFGPAFEIRTFSSIYWIAGFTALGVPLAVRGVDEPDSS